ncbi:Cro/Cl family transcriptional regulator [Burkholderia sp. AU28942]|uniref:Cro/Cl family transcriptional regulator n=1 Tax=Burkholderia TaxID=32008 RepID=UPI0009F1631E|nr:MULTISPECIES: Cro/Cl family transcriptional regulator [Burkholderia]MCA8308872.1 Cro/Cl family transcriptional regulator [Burkholderia sp. AU28942]QTO50871.1 Cro/Cl family transcriptional regulator [Burkholderia latens]
MRSVKYLDQLIEKRGLKNDLALAKSMGWPSSRMSQYRTGKRVMENETCLQVALALELDNPLPIIMAADADRAERLGQRSLWEVFSPRIAGISAALLLSIVTNFVTPSPAQAASSMTGSGTILHVMSNKWEGRKPGDRRS